MAFDACFAGSDRLYRETFVSLEERRDLVFTFIGFQRAGAIDQASARFHQAGGLSQQLALERGKAVDLRGCLEKWQVGMAPERARRRTGRERHRS